MPTFSLITTAANSPVSRRYQFLRCVIVATFIASFAATKARTDENRSQVATADHAAIQAADEGEVLATSASNAAGERGNAFCNGIRLQDEIVVVNVRNLCGCCDSGNFSDRLIVENYAVCDETGHRRWQPSDLQSFLAFDSSVPTVIFVHGNQITPGDAKCEGVALYRRIILHGCDSPRIRFVIFSWPSSKIGGLLRDVRVKAARTGPAGFQLAWLVNQMPTETPISFVGFSFGARIITGGLHVLAGGSLGGLCCLSEHVHADRPPMSIIMMASALHSYWLAAGQYHGLAMTQVSRMCLINNCDDPAMKYYDYIEPGFGGPQALGLCGPTCINRDYAQKIINRDVSCYVGNQHDLMRYVCARRRRIDLGLHGRFRRKRSSNNG